MIGDSHVMLSDEWPDMNLRGPKSRGGPTASLMVYVDDVDAMFARAVTAGAAVESAVANQFWGDRTGTLVDPFGHRWMLATHVEEVPPEEMERRMAEWSKQAA
jgi:PhnB protein